MDHWQGQGQEDENQVQQEPEQQEPEQQEPEQGQGLGQQEPEQGLGHLDLQSTSSAEVVEELVQRWLWGRCRGQGQEFP